MPTITELADAYRKMHKKRTDLDRRITALPIEDIDGKDTLMDEMEYVVVTLHDIARQVASLRAGDTAALRAKATILIGTSEDDLTTLCRSLARDVVDVV